MEIGMELLGGNVEMQMRITLVVSQRVSECGE